MYKPKSTGPTKAQMEDRYTAQANRANTMPKYIGLRVKEYTPVETNAADVSGFRGFTVVLARRKDITPPIATATPIAIKTAATSSRTSLGNSRIGGRCATVHMPAATTRPATGGGIRSSKERTVRRLTCSSAAALRRVMRAASAQWQRRARGAHTIGYHGPLQLLVRRHPNRYLA